MVCWRIRLRRIREIVDRLRRQAWHRDKIEAVDRNEHEIVRLGIRKMRTVR
jgi:hypothetical protein